MEIQYSRQAEKFLKKQPADISLRIRTAIHKLPRGDVKKLIIEVRYISKEVGINDCDKGKIDWGCYRNGR